MVGIFRFGSLMTNAPACAAVVAPLLMGTLLVAPRAVCAEEGLDEIVVTAQKKTERLQDVPIAITALSAAELADRGVRQAGDVTASVPNMMLNLPYGPEAQPTFTLRGVTTQDFSENQSSPIAMYVDEVYKSVGAVQTLQVYDLDRVEVLRGPQGTLYGKNATGGAVSFYSANPSLTQTDGYVTAGVGNYRDRSVRAAVGTPLVDDILAVRAAVFYEKRDGWVQSIVPGVEPLNGIDALAGRLTFLAKPMDGLTAALKLSFSRSGGTPYGAHALNIDPGVTGFTGSIPWFSNGAKYAVHKQIRNDNASLKLDWQVLPHAMLTSITGFDYGRWFEKSDDGGLPITARIDDPNTYYSSVNAFSQEIRLSSYEAGAFTWLGGLYYGRESVHANLQYHFFDGGPVVFTPPGGAGLYGFDEYNNFDQLKDSRAAFFNTALTVLPTVTLRAGVRFTQDKISVRNFYALEGGLLAPPAGYAPDTGPTLWTQTIPNVPSASYVQYSPSLVPPGGVSPPLRQDNNNVSFKAGADWKPSDALLTYVSFSQGYRGAAFNGQAFNAPAELNFASPEKLTSYEIGAKSEFLNRRAEFNVAIFHYDYRNQQFLDAFALPGGAGTGFHTVNAPKSRVDGAEFELRLKASEDVEVRSGLGVLHSKYEQLTLHGVDLAGNRLIQAPAYNVDVAVDWRFAHLQAGDLRLAVDANSYGKQYFDAPNTERIAQPGYTIANARLSFASSAKQGFAVGAWIKNIANREYIAYGLAQRDPSQGGLGFDYSLVGEPRTYGVDLTYRF
ncbi:MAG: TonB-dependent receptor [Pseudomonadota bacterium]|nr:TonB-dependent receptor [Pseudomonadota bacterium]